MWFLVRQVCEIAIEKQTNENNIAGRNTQICDCLSVGDSLTNQYF